MFGSDYYLDRLVLSAESDGYGFDSRISQNVEEVVQLFFLSSSVSKSKVSS